MLHDDYTAFLLCHYCVVFSFFVYCSKKDKNSHLTKCLLNLTVDWISFKTIITKLTKLDGKIYYGKMKNSLFLL